MRPDLHLNSFSLHPSSGEQFNKCYLCILILDSQSKLTAESAHLLAVEVEVVLVGGVGSAEVLVSTPTPPIRVWAIATAYGEKGILKITQCKMSG